MFDSMMTHASDPHDGIELLILREQMRNWRFYDHLRTDREAPARRPQIGTRTPVLAGDGSDLSAALQTIIEIGDEEALYSAIEDAFPKSGIAVSNYDGYFELEMKQHGLLRPLKTAELSDGTLRYLLLLAALLSPRPPKFMILNEPETSLHPDLLLPLARLIARAAARCQLIVVTHSDVLANAISEQAVVQEDCTGKGVWRDDWRRTMSRRRGSGRGGEALTAQTTPPAVSQSPHNRAVLRAPSGVTPFLSAMLLSAPALTRWVDGFLVAWPAVAKHHRFDQRGPAEIVDMVQRRAGFDENAHHFVMAQMRGGDQGAAVIGAGDVVSLVAEPSAAFSVSTSSATAAMVTAS